MMLAIPLALYETLLARQKYVPYINSGSIQFLVRVNKLDVNKSVNFRIFCLLSHLSVRAIQIKREFFEKGLRWLQKMIIIF